MFKRRDSRPWWQIVFRFFYPLGGWRRAVSYMRHRLGRLPDSPERIARGIGAGVFVSFTPFYGLHFVLAALIAKLVRGNILASLLGTFFGNPLTFVPISAMAVGFGQFMLGQPAGLFDPREFGESFWNSCLDLWHNVRAFFTGTPMDWHGLSQFYSDIFLPFMIGGILPGFIAATVCYFLTEPIIRAYQKRRNKRRRARLIRKAAEAAGNFKVKH